MTCRAFRPRGLAFPPLRETCDDQGEPGTAGEQVAGERRAYVVRDAGSPSRMGKVYPERIWPNIGNLCLLVRRVPVHEYTGRYVR